MSDHIEHQIDALAALLASGDRHAAERALAGLREMAWRRRAATVRGRRHAGPGTRAAVLGRAFVRRKPGMRAPDTAARPAGGKRRA